MTSPSIPTLHQGLPSCGERDDRNVLERGTYTIRQGDVGAGGVLHALPGEGEETGLSLDRGAA